MNYLAIIILSLVVIFLMNNKKVYTMKEVEPNENIKNKIQYIKDNIKVINKEKIVNVKDLEKQVQNIHEEYVLLCEINDLSDEDKEEMILNYIINNEVTCGFKFQYSYCGQTSKIKKILYSFIIACVNYVEMLTKQNFETFTCVLSKKESVVQDIKHGKIVTFLLSENLKTCVNVKSLKYEVLHRHKLNIKGIMSVFFTIAAGSVVTANILYHVINLFNGKSNLYDILACVLIYICYVNVTVKVYRPMGKFRIIASYLFPIYIVIYVIITTYYFVEDIIERCKVKNKKNFLISLIILFIVYLIFILIKK